MDNCILCGGEGELVEKRKTQAGDAAHLRVAISAIKEICILEGIYGGETGQGNQQNNVFLSGENTFNVAAFMKQIEDNVPGWAEHSKNALLAEYEEDCRKADEKFGRLIEVDSEQHEGNGKE